MKIVFLVQDKESSAVLSLSSTLREACAAHTHSDPIFIFEIQKSFLTRTAPFVLFNTQHRIAVEEIGLLVIPAEGLCDARIQQRKAQLMKLGVLALDENDCIDTNGLVQSYIEKMKNLTTAKPPPVQLAPQLASPSDTGNNRPLADSVPVTCTHHENTEPLLCGANSLKRQATEKWTNSRR